MGVPAFFRWLSRKYPSIVVHCVEQKSQQIQGLKVPVDATLPNPNDVEFDYLYLDMNGIIHPCCHPEDKAAPKDEEEMMEAIFEYIDRIFNIIRPRRLLYMAIDGVAPRAKMNQQRSRRFRAAKETIEKREDISRVREEIISRGCQLPPVPPPSSHFDSNCITPGTEFMARLAVCLKYYVHERMNHNPAWQGIKVILSDANVPGEGEHKIMDFIRRQRDTTDHDPNTHHCLYGADADLIMLGIATHEPHFTILREEFKPNQPKPCEICGQIGHEMKECTGTAKDEFEEVTKATVMEKEFIFIRLCVLREYLERELRIDGLPFPFDLERALDDWVFMCFFVGNDFLPHLPSLEIREGAIDRLIKLYKRVVPETHGYLTHNGKVNLARVQLMLNELGKVEDEIFRQRRQKDEHFRQKRKDRKQADKRRRMGAGPSWMPQGQFAPMPLGSSPAALQNPRQEAYQMRQMTTSLSANQSAATDLKSMLKKGVGDGEPPAEPAVPNGPSATTGQKRKSDTLDDSDSEPDDNVRLWEDGWKDRYYDNKFGVPSEDAEFKSRLTEQYTYGLCWVLGYYYQGCPSWKWFYPYHYAPFASDFHDIGSLRNDFDTGTTPFRPLEQLMGVFPASSGKFLPESWRVIMSAPDSPVIDFYPTNFGIDLNGKKWAWQGVALLPFVDESRLLAAVEPVYPRLTDDEISRNSLGSDKLFVYRQNKLYPLLKSLYQSYGTDQPAPEALELNPQLAQGMRGTMLPDAGMQEVLNEGGRVVSPIPSRFHDINKSYVVSVRYSDPHYPGAHIFEAKLLPSVKMPDRTLKPGGWSGGSYRPQTGFTRPPQTKPQGYQPPDSAQRMIRRSMTAPHGSGYYDRGPPQSSYHRDDQYYHGYHDYQPARGPPPAPRASAPSYANWNPIPPTQQYYPQAPPTLPHRQHSSGDYGSHNPHHLPHPPPSHRNTFPPPSGHSSQHPRPPHHRGGYSSQSSRGGRGYYN